MNIQQNDHVAQKDNRRATRARGLERIDTGPVLRRLRAMVGIPYGEVLAKINRLNGMRLPATRAAYLRFLGENVAASEDVSLEMPFYVGDFAVTNDAGKIVEVLPACLMRRVKDETKTDPDPAAFFAETNPLPEDVLSFLNGRFVGLRGRTLFWFGPVPSVTREFHGVCNKTGVPKYDRRSQTAYRQDRTLTKDEAAVFAGFDEAVRAQVLRMAPAYSPAPAN